MFGRSALVAQFLGLQQLFDLLDARFEVVHRLHRVVQQRLALLRDKGFFGGCQLGVDPLYTFITLLEVAGPFLCAVRQDRVTDGTGGGE